MTAIMIYMTCPVAEARPIARALLERRLIACANIMPPHESLYWWQGKIDNGSESAVVMKTRPELFEKARAAICELHSYDCPCIVAWPLTVGHDPFLKWIEAETEEAAS